MPGETEYCLLGPLVVRCAGTMVPVPPGKQRALLAALLLRAGQRVDAAELHRGAMGIGATAFSAGEPAELREAAAAGAGERRRPDSRDPAGRIPDPASVRASWMWQRFEASWPRAGRRRGRGRGRRPPGELAAGLALWRGEPLADVPSDALAAREVPRLAELRLQALEARIDADLHLGRQRRGDRRAAAAGGGAPAAGAAARAADDRRCTGTGSRPGRWPPTRRPAACWSAELGAEPGPELQRLHQQILAGGPVLVWRSRAGRLGGAARVPAGARPAAGGAVLAAAGHGGVHRPGRPSWTASPPRCTAAAGAGGVVAIHAIGGMPGVGKTALAVHAAHLLRDRFPDRQLFIDLHGHTPGQDPRRRRRLRWPGCWPRPGWTPGTCPGTWRAGRRCGGTGWPGSGRCWCWTTRPAARRSRRCCRAGTAAWCWSPAAATWATCPARSRRCCWRRLPPGAGAGDVRPAGAPRRRRPGRGGGGAGRAGRVPAAGDLACWPACTPGTRPGRWPTWPPRPGRSLLTLTAENDSVAAAFEVSYRHLAAGQQRFFRRLGLHPGTDDRRLRRRRPGRHLRWPRPPGCWTACTARAC